MSVDKETFLFVKKLKANNNKEWFDAHKADYQKAQQNMLDFVNELIKGISKFDSGIKDQEAKKCLYRIYKDVRFSKDKTPYKTHFGASINKGGRKSGNAGYYIHIEEKESFFGGGIYAPMPDVLATVRQEIDYNSKEFLKIINSAAFKKHFNGLWEDESLSTAPKGYAKDHPLIRYIKNKHFVASTSPFSQKEVLSDAFLKKCLDAAKALHPFLNFLNRAVDNQG